MGQKISNPKCKLLLHYYVFQKTIQKYLTDWKDKKDRHKIEKGYIIDPDWIKEWKRISDYDNIKTKYLEKLGIESTNINDDLNLAITQHLEPAIKDYEQNLIYYVKMNDFNVSNTFFSLEYLQNLCDETTYNLLETNGEIEKVEYIFKKKMLIIFFKTRNVIKIILFNEKNNNLINLKFLYNYNDRYNYNKDVSFFERKSSEQILIYLSDINIFNIKKYELHDSKKNNRLIYTLLYEEEKNIKNTITQSDKEISPKKVIPDSKIEEDEDQIQRTPTFLESNNIIAIYFISGDNLINKPMACVKNYTFKTIEEQLYLEYPEIKNDIACFLVNGKSINREATLEDNMIKDGDNIIICFKNYNTPDN